MVAKTLRGLALLLGAAMWTFYALRPREFFAGDFPQFYVLGRLALDGRFTELQDGGALSQAVQALVSPDIHWTLLPVYPPQVAMLFAPLSALPYRVAERAWLIISAALYVVVLGVLLRRCRALQAHRLTAWMVALAAPAAFQVLFFGQLSMVALACLVFGFAALDDRRPFVAGLCFGLLAYKPQYGLALAMVFLSARAWPVIAGAIVSGLGQFGVAWLIGGSAVIVRYSEVVREMLDYRATLQSKTHFLESLLPVVQLLPAAVVPVAYALACLAVLAVTVVTWRRPGPPQLRHAALVTAGLLVSPHLFVYDLVLLVPVLFWVADWLVAVRQQQPRRGRDLDECLALLYAWPIAGPAITAAIAINLGPLVMLALLMLLAREQARNRSNAGTGSSVSAAVPSARPRAGRRRC